MIIMSNYILPALKDKLLYELKDNRDRYKLVARGKEFGLQDDLLQSLIRQFDKMGLVTILQTFNGTGLQVIRVEVETDEFLLRGGFTFKEEILEKQLEKIILEIEAYKDQLSPKVFKNIMAGITAIGTAWAALKIV